MSIDYEKVLQAFTLYILTKNESGLNEDQIHEEIQIFIENLKKVLDF